jgi:undecaprenyl-diphosphatase
MPMETLIELLRDLPLLAKALIMGVVEGLTEFLPVSSTGHLILTGALIGFDDDKAKVFDIAIQTGAMVSVVWVYRQRFIQNLTWQFVRHLLIAFIPAAVLGLLFGSLIKSYLFSPVPVAIVLILGGFVILWVERWVAANPHRVRIHDVDDISNRDALKLGIAQAFALIPGTSRSGATIIGGMIVGLSRKAATEFSFFLAVPTLVAAGAYDLLRNRHLLGVSDLPLFSVGLVSAYITALIVIRWLIRWVSHHSFNGFAYYRIGFGLLVLLVAF